MKFFSKTIVAVMLLISISVTAAPILPSQIGIREAQAEDILDAAAVELLCEAEAKIEAAVPSIDIGSLTSLGVVPTYDASNTGEGIEANCKTFWGTVIDTLIEVLKKQILDMVVDQIINWIQGGGTPKFITDWSGFLRDAANEATGRVFEELGLGFLCNHFSFQLQIALLPVNDSFARNSTCTLDDIVGNIESFFDDWKNGGWIAYTSSFSPQNNFYGALLMAEQELHLQTYNAQEAAWSEGIAGQGFLGTKECDENGENCKITTPGRTVGSLVSKAIESDIDWLVNADDLTEYLAAIGDAIINRLIVEGVSGLQGLTTDKKPEGGYVASGGTSDCAGIPSPAYQTCLNYVSGGYLESEGGAFGSAVTDFASTTQYIIDIRTDAQFFLSDSFNELGGYNIALQNLLVSFGGLSCIDLPIYMTSISTEITAATILANTIANDANLNQAGINQLIQAKADALALEDDEWVGLTAIIDELDSVGLLNEPAALALKANAEIQNTGIKDHNFITLAIFNDNLNQCILGP